MKSIQFAILFLLSLLLSSNSIAISPAERHEKILELTPAYPDKELAAYIDNLGQTLVSYSDMAGEKFTFTVIDEPDLNAYTTGDGYIYIYRGLLAYMKNEAELASVLAHEIGHVTNNHIGRQTSSATGAKILTTLAAILSGSGDVYEAGNLYAASIIRGHGREMELEADHTGAQIISKAGYNPEAMIDMLSMMKSNEALQKQRAKSKNKTRQTYHGIFSTHPRNDVRLRSVISKAKALAPDATKGHEEAPYRAVTDGLVWGENFEAKGKKSERYSNPAMAIRFDYPKDWQFQEESEGVMGSPASKEAFLQMSHMPRTIKSPKEFIRDTLGILNLSDASEISPGKLKGYTGVTIATKTSPQTRIAVIYYKRNAYIFKGTAPKDDKSFAEFDKLFLESIKSFRPISKREIAGSKPKTIQHVIANKNTTFSRLQKKLKLNNDEIEDMRVMNDAYPTGEPKPGEWIKIIKQ